MLLQNLVFVFDFQSFDYNAFPCQFLQIPDIHWASWIWMNVLFLPQIWETFSTYFFEYTFWSWLDWWCSRNPFNFLIFHLFSFCSSGWIFSNYLCSSSLVLSSAWSSLFWTLLVTFLVQLCSSASWFLFITFKNIVSLSKILLCSCIIFLILVSPFMTLFWILCQDNHIIVFHEDQFLEIYLIPLFGKYFPGSLFSLTLYWYLCVRH